MAECEWNGICNEMIDTPSHESVNIKKKSTNDCTGNLIQKSLKLLAGK